MNSGGRSSYVPALDGIRALAVVAVVAFHADLGIAGGGFLGVSVFFTLSGFLIATLLLAEHRSSGRVDLRKFYARRARRLLPAAWLCIALVLAVGGLWSNAQRRELGGDALASLGNLANWRFAFSDTSYQELFTQDPSPLAHFWSLAIEEQMYLLLPFVVAVSLRRGRRMLLVVVGALTLASVVSGLVTSDFDVAYNATYTRAAELLVGVLLAIALSTRRVSALLESPRAARRLRLAGSVGLVALGAGVALVRVDDAWLARGGFLAVSLASAAVVAAVWSSSSANEGPATRSNSRMRWCLERPALVAVGKVSYGIYLYHWPIFVFLTSQRVGFGGIGLLVVRLLAVGVMTWASYRLLEQPVRSGRRLARPGLSGSVAVVSAGALAMVALAVPMPAPTVNDELFAEAADGLITFGASDATAADSPGTRDDIVIPSDTGRVGEDASEVRDPVVPADDRENPGSAQQAVIQDDVVGESASAPIVERRPVVMVAGSDSAAIAALSALDVDVVDAVQSNCPVASGFETKLGDGSLLDISTCESIVARMDRFLDESDPDVVIVSLGPLDDGVIRQQEQEGFPTEDEIAEFGARREAAEREIALGVDVLLDQDAPIVLAWWGSDGLVLGALERFAVENDLVRGVAIDGESLVDLVRPIVTRQTYAQQVAAAAAGDPVRVLVTGDSTSLILARALHDASDDLDVVWAGQNGCPFVRARAIRIGSNVDVTELACADFAEKVPPLIESFKPDVVLVMAGPVEMTEQFYPGDDAGHLPGSVEYVAFHRKEMDAFLGAVGADVPVLIADAPPIAPGPFSTADMIRPERLAGWNAQIDDWIATHAQVGRFEYVGPLAFYEAAEGSIRPDGVHADVDQLADLAANGLVDRLLEAGR